LHYLQIPLKVSPSRAPLSCNVHTYSMEREQCNDVD
jgi:hypothetical protein